MDAKKTIMVVDDNPDLVAILETLLLAKGYNVVTAGSGPELLSLLQDHRPDLILLDIMLPDMDGLELLAGLKGTPDTSSIPVILVTAKIHYTDIMEGYRRGADLYITKPFTSKQLLNDINVVLARGRP